MFELQNAAQNTLKLKINLKTYLKTLSLNMQRERCSIIEAKKYIERKRYREKLGQVRQCHISACI